MPSFPLRVSPRSAAAAVVAAVVAAPVVVFVVAAPVVVVVVAAAAVVVGVKRCKGFIKGEALLLQSRLFSYNIRVLFRLGHLLFLMRPTIGLLDYSNSCPAINTF